MEMDSTLEALAVALTGQWKGNGVDGTTGEVTTWVYQFKFIPRSSTSDDSDVLLDVVGGGFHLWRGGLLRSRTVGIFTQTSSTSGHLELQRHLDPTSLDRLYAGHAPTEKRPVLMRPFSMSVGIGCDHARMSFETVEASNGTTLDLFRVDTKIQTINALSSLRIAYSQNCAGTFTSPISRTSTHLTHLNSS